MLQALGLLLVVVIVLIIATVAGIDTQSIAALLGALSGH